MNKQVLFLHGAGAANKDRYSYIFDELKEAGIQTFTFNFSGFNGINLESSSISKRYIEAKNKIKEFNLQHPLNLMGSSMGAYICLKLAEEFEIANLILFCPAMYDTKLFNIPFGPKFTETIRRSDGWKNSDGFSIAHKFRGKVLIVTGDKENVVPKELTEMLIESFNNTSYKKVLKIPGATHALGPYIKTRPKLVKQISREMESILL